MAIEITTDFILKSLALRHPNFNETCKLALKLRMHADGFCPEELINVRRPSEPEEIKNYRFRIYVPITKNPISKVINSLEKIRRSQDWVIQYDKEKVKSSITEDETLESYCEHNYPVHTSITNWTFSELLKQYLLDANGVVAIIPGFVPDSNNQYVKPVAMFFESLQVIDFIEGQYAVLLSKDTSTYTTPGGRITRTNGAIYYILTENQVVKYEQINSQGQLDATMVYDHNIGRLPVFRVNGLFKTRINNGTIYESRIASMIPSLDEAAREYSDLQAEIVQHIHSEKYAYTNTECPDCKGVGYKMIDGERKICDRCGGNGSILNTSPFGIHLIDAAKAGENQLPAPPIGYIQKTSDIAKLQDDRVRQHIYNALATLNMEFLAETPLSQSGTAKEVDRDELNNFVNGIAEDIVRILDNVYYFINEYRYRVIVPNKEEREAMLPKINVPTQYDLLSSDKLMSAIATSKSSNMNPVIVRAMEIDYAKKKFYIDQSVSYEAQAIFELDPFYGISESDKMTRKSNGGITELDYIISSNIIQFVNRAADDDPNFYELSNNDKRAVIRKMAEQVKAENEKLPTIPTDLGGLNSIPPVTPVQPTPPVTPVPNAKA